MGLAVSRRWVLKTVTLVGGGLAVGAVRPFSVADGPEITSAEFTAMIRIYPDNRCVIVPPTAEMGQDVLTSQAKIIADEMDLDWDAVELEIAPHHPDFYDANGFQSAGDSRTMRRWYLPLRQLGAAGRQVMLQAAAGRWQITPELCGTRSGVVIERNGNRRASYGELAEAAAQLTLPAEPKLKADAELRLIGRSVPRKDALDKVTGRALFGADVRLPGQLFAAVFMAPQGGSEVVSLDQGAAQRMPGVVGVFVLDSAIAVVADSWWQARQAVGSLDVEFSSGAVADWDDAAIDAELDRCLTEDRGVTAMLKGNPDDSLSSPRVFEARYSVPFLAHACLEPMTATVSVEPDRVIAIAPTQAPQRFAKRVADRTGRALETVEMRNTFLGGGFGRKGLDSVALLQATDLSVKLGRPVQVIWDRETDTRHDQYRPAAKFRHRAALSDSGAINAVDLRVASQSLRRQLFKAYYKADNHELAEDLFVYDAAARRHLWLEAELPVNVGYWRAVGRSSHPFATESFIDELAHLAGQDCYRYRRMNLTARPRSRAALDAVAEASGWGRKLPSGRGLGIAVQEGWESVCAQVAEVSVSHGRLVVHDIWAAVDCGTVISPDSVKAQIEGGIVYALTAAMTGRINIKHGAVVQGNFDSYPILTLPQTPAIHVVLMASRLPPGGVGELGVPPCAPAVANALFAASGYRARSLPLIAHSPYAA